MIDVSQAFEPLWRRDINTGRVQQRREVLGSTAKAGPRPDAVVQEAEKSAEP
jgi:hypothetical protein